jgi:hypothetical protein
MNICRKHMQAYYDMQSKHSNNPGVGFQPSGVDPVLLVCLLLHTSRAHTSDCPPTHTPIPLRVMVLKPLPTNSHPPRKPRHVPPSPSRCGPRSS